MNLPASNPSKRPFERLPYPDADACRRCNGGGIEPGATWRCSLCKGTGLADSNPSKRLDALLEEDTARIRWLLNEVERLQRLLTEHHAVGAFDNALVGDDCPICKRVEQ